MTTFRLTKVQEFEANGGPYIEDRKNQVTRTRKGRFTISAIEKHVSSGRWAYSTIAWGTLIKLEHNVVKIQKNGQWINLSSTPGFSVYRNNEFGLTRELIDVYNQYKMPLINAGKLPASEAVRALPYFWIFNDFGHVTIKYYQDLNHNNREDNGERMSDFMHTIPSDEYFSSYGMDVVLPSSHGCIHLHPKDIDRIISSYAKVGTVVAVHEYRQTSVPIMFESKLGKPPFELHFFPFVNSIGKDIVSGKLAVYSCYKVS